MRVLKYIEADISLFFRSGIIQAYLFLTIALCCAVFFSPAFAKPAVYSGILIMETVTFGFFFAGGIVLLEKNQNVFSALFTTSFGTYRFMVSRSLALTAIASLSAVLLGICANVQLAALLSRTAGVLLTAFFFSVLGLGIGFKAKSLNGYFVWSGALVPVFLAGYALRYFACPLPLLLLFPGEAMTVLLSDFIPRASIAVWSLYSAAALSIWTLIMLRFTSGQIKSYLGRK